MLDWLSKECWNDLIINSRLQDKGEVDFILGFETSQFQYSNLKNAYQSAENRYHKNDAPSCSVRSTVTRFKKGSSSIHECISTSNRPGAPEDKTQCRTFFRLIDCVPPARTRTKGQFTGWNHSYCSSSVRVFLFKFYSNIWPSTAGWPILTPRLMVAVPSAVR